MRAHSESAFKGAGCSCCSLALDFDCIREPSCTLIVDPLALSFFATLCSVIDTYPVLTIVCPLSYVLVAVREDHSSVAVFLSLHEITFVALTILVCQFTLAFEEIMAEGALIGSLRLSEVVHT